MKWYYAEGGKQLGPVDESVLDDLVRQRRWHPLLDQAAGHAGRQAGCQASRKLLEGGEAGTQRPVLPFL